MSDLSYLVDQDGKPTSVLFVGHDCKDWDLKITIIMNYQSANAVLLVSGASKED